MEETFSTAAVADLDPEKVNLFSKGLLKILSSKRAEDTFAQIIDGKPTLSGCGMPIMDWKQHWMNVTPKEIESRHQPDPKSIALFQDFRENLRPVDLRISAKTAQAFQNSESTSQEFNLRLLEIIAVAVHTLAVKIYTESHPNLSFPLSEQKPNQKYLTPSLYHPFYVFSNQYPNGRADVVGYWAESRIFGGAVLFEHELSKDCLLGAYINPLASRFQKPKIFQLSIAQISQFCELGHNKGTQTRLPFSPEKDTRLLELHEAFGLNVYREKYEKCPERREDIHYPNCRRQPEPGFREALHKQFPDLF